jgi:UDP-glucose:(heptosyl)LPS alpha-1,3-glucosyltransferase
MNIGFVVHDFDTREGHGRYAVELVSRLAREHRVTLYAASAAADVPDGVRFRLVPAVRRPAHATMLTFPTAFAAVRGPHDVVHVQGWSAHSADVATAHIVLEAWRDAVRSAHVPPGLGERLLGNTVASREARFYRGDRVRAVIAPSARIKEDLARHYGRRDDVTVVPHAFPTAEQVDRQEARTRFQLPQDGLVALYAGDARKGLDVALKAIASVDGVRLLVVSRSKLEEYQAAARTLNAAERVWWVNGLPDLTPAYGAADVLLHPTIYDAFGLVVAEAMAHGVIPLVSDQAGIAELVTDRVSGWVVRPRRPEESAAALRAIQQDGELRARLATEARKLAQTRSWDDVARETVAVYEEVQRS